MDRVSETMAVWGVKLTTELGTAVGNRVGKRVKQTLGDLVIELRQVFGYCFLFFCCYLKEIVFVLAQHQFRSALYALSKIRVKLIRPLARLEDVLPNGYFVLEGLSVSKFISRRNIDGFLRSFHMRGAGFYIFAMFPGINKYEISRQIIHQNLSSDLYLDELSVWRIIHLDG